MAVDDYCPTGFVAVPLHPQKTLKVVTFDKSLHEYYTKLSDFHAQFRMVRNRSAFGRFACKELQSDFKRVEKPLLRTKNKGTCVCKLEKYMMLLVHIIHKVVEQTDKYKNTVK